MLRQYLHNSQQNLQVAPILARQWYSLTVKQIVGIDAILFEMGVITSILSIPIVGKFSLHSCRGVHCLMWKQRLLEKSRILNILRCSSQRVPGLRATNKQCTTFWLTFPRSVLRIPLCVHPIIPNVLYSDWLGQRRGQHCKSCFSRRVANKCAKCPATFCQQNGCTLPLTTLRVGCQHRCIPQQSFQWPFF
jgi:hypothetical protein